jgi:p-hydroxybenzoate 3-monooxygenase
LTARATGSTSRGCRVAGSGSTPQTDLFIELADRRTADGADIRWRATVTEVLDRDSDLPGVRWTDADGAEHELRGDILVGADGSRSVLRHTIPEDERRFLAHEYPFAWFGFITQAPKSAPELVYNASDHGFVLLSQRTETYQRHYFQCSPTEDPDTWDDARIWETVQHLLAGHDGFQAVEGEITEKSVLVFRGSVIEPVRFGRSFLAGDAAHTVPPTGAKGLNLAIADIVVLYDVLTRWFAGGDDDVLDEYSRRVNHRVWRAEHFSAWMTRMMHNRPNETRFEARRRVAEVRTLVESKSGMRYLAESYTGWGDIL